MPYFYLATTAQLLAFVVLNSDMRQIPTLKIQTPLNSEQKKSITPKSLSVNMLTNKRALPQKTDNIEKPSDSNDSIPRSESIQPEINLITTLSAVMQERGKELTREEKEKILTLETKTENLFGTATMWYKKIFEEEIDLNRAVEKLRNNIKKIIDSSDLSSNTDEIINSLESFLEQVSNTFFYYINISMQLPETFEKTQQAWRDYDDALVVQMAHDDIITQTNDPQHRRNSEKKEMQPVIEHDRQVFNDKRFTIQTINERIELYGRVVDNNNLNKRNLETEIKKPETDFKMKHSGEGNIALLENFIEVFEEKIKNLNDCQKIIHAFQRKLAKALSGNLDPEIEDLLKDNYYEIKYASNELREFILKNNVRDAFRFSGKIQADILMESLKVLTTNYDTSLDRETIIDKINGIRANAVMLGKTLNSLPRETVADLDLRTMPIVGRLEDVPAKELVLKNPTLVHKLYSLTKKEFPGLSADELISDIHSKDLTLTISLINNQPICFFGKEKKAENIFYLDWFIANSDLDIKGLGEATIRLAFDDEHEKTATHYAVAKPNVKSFELVIEKFGFTAHDGAFEDDDHHHYAQVRRLPNDENFASKKLSAQEQTDFIQLLRQRLHNDYHDFSKLNGQRADNHPDYQPRSREVHFKNTNMLACLVSYPKKYDHHTDIDPASEEGWFYRELKNQTTLGYVLTRYIKVTDNPQLNSHYAIFEKDKIDPLTTKYKNDLTRVINGDAEKKAIYNNAHSVSKKALSS
jgi:hypothetical protein